jgi:hypothetical protein
MTEKQSCRSDSENAIIYVLKDILLEVNQVVVNAEVKSSKRTGQQFVILKYCRP